MVVEEISYDEFNNLNDEQRMRLSKKQLINLILSGTPNFEGLAIAIRELTGIVEDFKKVTEENSTQIVALKVEVELVKDENRSLSSRINDMEQRSRNKNIEIVGLREPAPNETETSLVLGFIKDAVKVNIEINEVDACHQVPSKRRDNKRIVILALKDRSKHQ